MKPFIVACALVLAAQAADARPRYSIARGVGDAFVYMGARKATEMAVGAGERAWSSRKGADAVRNPLSSK